MKKFDYKNEYQKFKPKSKVKITFMDGKEEATKKVRIISINAKEISFEDKKNVYECTPSEIRNIKKITAKLPILIIISVIFVLLAIVNFLVSTVSSSRYYNGVEIESITDYGLEFD